MEGGKAPLGDLAISLTCFLTDPDGPFGTDGLELLYSIPILGHYGQLEEEYTRVSKEAYIIDTLGKGEWPVYFRSLALPTDDSLFC